MLVVANALGVRGTLQHLAGFLHLDRRVQVGGSAFGAEECAAVRGWVEGGGALLLITDHAPTGESAAALAREFNVEMMNGWAEEPHTHDSESDNWERSCSAARTVSSVIIRSPPAATPPSGSGAC